MEENMTTSATTSVGAVATTETGTEAKAEVTETKKTFDELLQDKEYQSAFDKKIAQSLQTAKVKWDEENKAKIAEAERLAKMDKEEKARYENEQKDKRIAELEARENARSLKDEAINIISEKEIPVAYLDLFDFEHMTAEQVKQGIETIATLRNKDRENYLNAALKQKTPTQKQITGVEEEDPYLKGFESV